MLNSHSPIIISASRATDIPALYGDWFINRLKEGYVIRTNPFNGKKYKISFDKTQLIVFWTKNPEPFFNKLEYLNKYGLNYYLALCCLWWIKLYLLHLKMQKKYLQ